LNALAIPFEIDPRLVRGLDYYTKTAFELTSPDLGSQDALAGGGRYDLLTQELGGKPTPGVGFAAGIERLMMVLEKKNFIAPDEVHPSLFIAAADENTRTLAIAMTMELRAKGIPVETDFLNRSLKAQMREADRQKARFVLVIGTNERESGSASLKNMETGEEKQVSLASLAEELQRSDR